MEIRDPVHGAIHILDEEIPIIRHPFFQRLRSIKQLGFSEYVFPGATHTRFIHSLGVMSIGEKAFDRLIIKAKTVFHLNFESRQEQKDVLRIKETFKLACLLHDVGHAPLSHSTESVMPLLGELKIPKRFLFREENLKRQASHEDFTIKAIADSSFSDSFKLVEKNLGVERAAIAELITGSTINSKYFNIKGINFFPLLSLLVSSELDCDRMDYLLRDSYFCGVSYGNFDLDWLLDNLEVTCDDERKRALLGISERAVVTFDDFLLSRYHMFIMVYFHYRAVCLEQLLIKYFKSANEYQIPPDIEEYIEHDDHFLMKVLRHSKNPYAQHIVKNQIPEKIFESFNNEQLKHLDRIQKFLDSEKIETIRCSSKGRLSKYYSEQSTQLAKLSKPAIKYNNRAHFGLNVVRTLFTGPNASTFSIDNATDLFQKFSKAHAVNRLHCWVEHLSEKQNKELKKLIESTV